jgi:phosphotransferase system enzyme I (PtsI)
MVAPTPTSHPSVPMHSGRGVSKGIAVGKAWVFQPGLQEHSGKKSQGIDVEIARFKQAQKLVLQKLEKIVAQTRLDIGDHEAEIFEAHQMMIQDEELVSPILYMIEQERCSAERAVEKSFQAQIEIFQTADSDYMRERALDLKDLKIQLLSELDPTEKPNLSKLFQPVVLIAEDLTPSQTITLDRKNVLGIITEKGGETSHTAIIARTLGIPAITGVPAAMKFFAQADQIAIDGAEGTIFKIETPELRDHFLAQVQAQASGKQKIQVFRGKPTLTGDAHQISLYGNIGSLKDAESVKEGDGEGVGLFRTEFLYMEREQAPTLDEQTKSYRDVLNVMAPKEVIIRTLDVGGDKFIPYIHIAKEENPFLGVRAVRYCLQERDFFKTQIKAMLLANDQGNLAIMLPMISRASEAKECAELIHECHSELSQIGGAEYAAKPYKVGAMVEIPALIFEMRELKEHVSFVSVGTNDLLQYSVAVDRMNPVLQALYSPYNLGFIRMMNILAKDALEAGLEVSICGELGGSEEFIPLWLAMGYQKLSMTPGEILNRRALISKFNLVRCRSLLKEVLHAKTEVEVKSKLADFLKRERDR